MSLQHQDAGSIPSLVQWVKGSGIVRLKLHLRSDPWSGKPICHRAAEKEKKEKKKKKPGGMKRVGKS